MRILDTRGSSEGKTRRVETRNRKRISEFDVCVSGFLLRANGYHFRPSSFSIRTTPDSARPELQDQISCFRSFPSLTINRIHEPFMLTRLEVRPTALHQQYYASRFRPLCSMVFDLLRDVADSRLVRHAGISDPCVSVERERSSSRMEVQLAPQAMPWAEPHTLSIFFDLRLSSQTKKKACFLHVAKSCHKLIITLRDHLFEEQQLQRQLCVGSSLCVLLKSYYSPAYSINGC